MFVNKNKMLITYETNEFLTQKAENVDHSQLGQGVR